MSGYYLWLIRVLCLLTLCCAGAAQAQDQEEMEPLVVVHSSRTPPLSYVGFNGEQKGLVVEYWRMWSRLNDIPVRIVLTDWAETLRMVRDGEADIHGGLYLTSGREKQFDFASSYFDLKAAIFVRKGLGVGSLEELGDHKVGVLEKGYSEYYLKKHYSGMARRAYPNASAMVEAAVAGDVDAMLCECPTVTYLLGTLGMLQEFDMLEPLYTRSIHPAVAKGNKAMLALVEESIAAISEDECERVFSRWTIPTSSYGAWLKIILACVIVLVFGLLLSLFLRPRKRG